MKTGTLPGFPLYILNFSYRLPLNIHASNLENFVLYVEEDF